MAIAELIPTANPTTPLPRQAPVSQPKPHRWTLETYRELGKHGFFRDQKTMLIDGEIHTMPMPFPPHATSLKLVQEYLQTIPMPGYHYRGQSAFDIGTRNDPGPDFAIVPGGVREYEFQHPRTAAWIIEISESTVFFDMTTKAELYATANVPDYWVLDLDNRKLHVFRDPVPLPTGLGATAYRTHLTFEETETVVPLMASESRVIVSQLLPTRMKPKTTG